MRLGRHTASLIAIAISAFSSSLLHAQEDESVWNLAIDSVTVESYIYRSPVREQAGGITLWNTQSMNILPQILGNADPLHYAQMLPGIQTNSEIRSGIYIDGCDSQHTQISINGVPLYNVSHLLGIFSAFNTDHLTEMSISRGVVSAASPNRLGGALDLRPRADLPSKVDGTLTVGLISSQGTVAIPIGDKTALTLSLRGSYLNLLYSRWLSAENNDFRYSFYDGNISFQHKADSRNTIFIDLYAGSDLGGFADDKLLLDMKARWGNGLLTARWQHDNGCGLEAATTAYVTSYTNRVTLGLEQAAYRLDSGITDIGLRSDLSLKGWTTGAEVVWHSIQPQSFEQSGGFAMADNPQPLMRSFEISAYGNYEYPVTPQLKLSGGVRGSLFIRGGSLRGGIDPSLRIAYDAANWQISATYALRHQYLFQTGFSDCGLPTEFWISAGPDLKPQYAHEVSLGGSSYLFRNRYKISVDLFWRKLYHQLGYRGSVLDLANTLYDLDGSLMHGRGHNYGATLMFSKCTGALTGWVSYTYTRARRSFDEAQRRKLYNASHERPHELTAVATYSLKKHWDFGASFVCASGTPFTPAEQLYLLNNNLIIKYGDYNSARLRPYLRLDISVNYKWSGRRVEHRLNLSVYNLTAHKNELFRRLSRPEDIYYAYVPVSFVLWPLPSLSYNIKF